MKLSEFLGAFEAPVLQEDDGFLTHCPAHSDTDPSLRIAVSDKGKILVKCRAGCDTKDVLAKLGVTFGQLVNMYADIEIDPATSTDAPADVADIAKLAKQLDVWHRELMEVFPGALDYAEKRFGVTHEDAVRLGLGYDDKTNRLVVPFRDLDGVSRGYQARALDAEEKVRWLGPKSPTGASWARVGFFPGGSSWDEVLITEGPGDALTAAALGYDAIGVRGASLAAKPAVVEEIALYLGDRTAIIAGDADPSGRQFTAKLGQALAQRDVRVKILDVPDGEDLTSWRQKDPGAFTREAVRAILSAQELTSTGAILRGRDDERYPLSDLGNARYVRDTIIATGSGVKHSPEAGFFLLGEGIWSHDKLDRTRSIVQETADRVAHIATQLWNEHDHFNRNEPVCAECRRWRAWAKYSQSTNGINAALRELQALPDVATDLNDFDRHPDLLAARNGVINLRTGKLQDHDAGLLLTRRIDVDYDPKAQAPRWTQFLDEVFPKNPEMPAFIQRLVGYGITGRTTEHCFAVLWGTGSNGKSVFTNTISEVFREISVITPFQTFEERPSGGIPNDLAALKGARLVMGSEGEQGRPMAEAVLKRVTGEDTISARFMRREFFEFRPQFLLLLASNFKPSFKGQDEGLWRRVKLIPWQRYFKESERDHYLGEALLSEREGILAWAVRGARDWYRKGLQDPDSVRDATREYRETSDVLTGFFPGEYVADPIGTVPQTQLFHAFQEWADANNYLDLKKWSSRAFYAALEERGLHRKKSNGAQRFYGIRKLRASDEQIPEEPPAHEPEKTFKLSAGPSLTKALQV